MNLDYQALLDDIERVNNKHKKFPYSWLYWWLNPIIEWIYDVLN